MPATIINQFPQTVNLPDSSNALFTDKRLNSTDNPALPRNTQITIVRHVENMHSFYCFAIADSSEIVGYVHASKIVEVAK